MSCIGGYYIYNVLSPFFNIWRFVVQRHILRNRGNITLDPTVRFNMKRNHACPHNGLMLVCWNKESLALLNFKHAQPDSSAKQLVDYTTNHQSASLDTWIHFLTAHVHIGRCLMITEWTNAVLVTTAPTMHSSGNYTDTGQTLVPLCKLVGCFVFTAWTANCYSPKPNRTPKGCFLLKWHSDLVKLPDQLKLACLDELATAFSTYDLLELPFKPCKA